MINPTFYFYKLNILTISGTKIGTDEVKTTPEKNAIIEISDVLLLFITGSKVSIAVAPATETDSKLPKDLATKGIVKIAITSLKTLLKKATLPSSALIFESSIADREYHPSPEEIASDSPKEIGRIKDPINPPNREPIIVEMGKNHIFLPYFFRSLNTLELSPISIPTKKSSRQRPMSIKVSEFAPMKGDLKNSPKITPTKIEIDIPIISQPPYFYCEKRIL